MLQMLTERFTKYPKEIHDRKNQKRYWHEPHKNWKIGLPDYPAHYFETHIPLITMSYYEAIDGKKKSSADRPAEASDVPYWGPAQQLWERLI